MVLRSRWRLCRLTDAACPLRVHKVPLHFPNLALPKNLSPSALVDQFRASLDFSRAFDFVHAMVGAGLSPPGDALAVRTNHRQNGERPRIVIARRPKADVAISRNSLRIRRGFPMIQPGTARFPRRFAPRNDNSDSLAPPNHHCNTRSCLRRSLPVKGMPHP